MFVFDSNHIFTGQIKQLLSSFELPTVKVYNPDLLPILSVPAGAGKNNVSYTYYIKDDNIQYATKGTTNEIQWHKVRPYYYAGQQIKNFTKTLQLKSNIYDSYTHEYLGDYLRFLRDYEHVNLMPLYNCFSNRICNNIKYSGPLLKAGTATFDSSDTKYKIYMVPVKLQQKYTIAIDSNAPVEFACGIYSKYFVETKDGQNLLGYTYKKVNKSQFNQPFLYENLVDIMKTIREQSTSGQIDKLYTQLSQNEANLKLFIKLPVGNTSSVVVMEGDYLNYNDKFLHNNIGGTDNPPLGYVHNRAAVNTEAGVSYDAFKPITELQLLKFNAGTSYPFADRLMEYLCGQAITDTDEINDNVKRVQQVMFENRILTGEYGFWDNKIKSHMYDFMNLHPKAKCSEDNHDILGYVDKDVENWYRSTKKENNKIIVINTLKNIDIYKGE